MLDPTRKTPDALAVIDVDPASRTIMANWSDVVDMPNAGDELHHFGWNACSSCLCPYSPHPHMERRYLVVPGLRSSRIHISIPNQTRASRRIVKVIEPETVMRAHRLQPAAHHHTAGPTEFISMRWAHRRATGRAASSCMDPETFELKGRWELRSRTAVPGLRFLVASGLTTP